METILVEIDRALNAGIHYGALVLALSVPDICASLEHPVGHAGGSNKSGYIKWYNDNLAAKYPGLTGGDLYSLRSGVVHNGRFGGGKYGRIAFTLPSPMGGFTGVVVEDAYCTDAEEFCRVMIDAARAWLISRNSDKNVRRNLTRLVEYRPQGLKPYISGVPMIA